MRIFRRVVLLGLFGAAGVGLALGLGFLTDTQSNAAGRPSDSRPVFVSMPVEAPVEVTVDAPGEIIVEPRRPFANQSPAAKPASPDLSKAAAEAAPLLKWAAEMLGQGVGEKPTGLADKVSKTSASHEKIPADKVSKTSAPREEIPADKISKTSAPHEEIPAGTVAETGPSAAETLPRRIQGLKVSGSDGKERLSINIQDADIREVLDLLGKQGNLNILTSNQVQGRVSATLCDVDLNSALDAILKSAGLCARREGNFIFVGNNADFESMERSMDRVGTRVYRPNYIQASELAALIAPVLTQGVAGVGLVSVTTKAEQGIGADDTGAGGDNYAGTDAVLVRDYEAVMDEIDQLVAEIDVRPTQVQIEAMILSIELSDDYDFGVSFEVLRQFPHLRFGWGTPESSLDNFEYAGGLNVAFLDDSLGAFVEALETVGDTDVIGTPRLLVVNKHRAEIQVGESRGYVSTTQTETARTQSVEFLELGILLRIRPFISSDGIIRMEVHPEISDGDVDVKEGFTLPNKQVTQVTTNVMVHDGCTVVIGGLLKEELKIDRTQVPLLGSLPVIGVAFRTKSEELKRRELIVLLTPHIVYEPDTCGEGVKAACEFHRRQDVVREKTSPLGKRSLGRRYFRKAQQAWAMGDRNRAMRLAEMAVNFDPNNRAAIDLRSNIWLGRRTGEHTLPPARRLQSNPLDGRQMAPWILDDLGAQDSRPGVAGEPLAPIPMNAVPMEAMPGGGVPQHPIDPGQPGRRFDIKRPERLEPF